MNAIVNKASVGSPRALSRLPSLTFSFGRGLQVEAMSKWVAGNEVGAKQAFEVRAKAYWLAAREKLEIDPTPLLAATLKDIFSMIIANDPAKDIG